MTCAVSIISFDMSSRFGAPTRPQHWASHPVTGVTEKSSFDGTMICQRVTFMGGIVYTIHLFAGDITNSICLHPEDRPWGHRPKGSGHQLKLLTGKVNG